MAPDPWTSPAQVRARPTSLVIAGGIVLGRALTDDHDHVDDHDPVPDVTVIVNVIVIVFGRTVGDDSDNDHDHE